MARKLLDFARAGALAVGIACLLGLWFHGFTVLGLRGEALDIRPDFFGSTIPALLVAPLFGFREPASSALALLGRYGATLVAALIAGAVALGIVFVFAMTIGEHKLPPVFLVLGVAGVAAGLRRLPANRAARIALGALVGLLLLTRLLAFWPHLAHRLTQLAFPLDEGTVRDAFEKDGCGPYCFYGRTRLVSFASDRRYHLDQWQRHLAADSRAQASLEVQHVFFEDGCGEVTDARPEVAPVARGYPSFDACVAQQPMYRPHPWSEEYLPRRSPCCTLKITAHAPGEKLDVRRTLQFVYFGWTWRTHH